MASPQNKVFTCRRAGRPARLGTGRRVLSSDGVLSVLVFDDVNRGFLCGCRTAADTDVLREQI